MSDPLARGVEPAEPTISRNDLLQLPVDVEGQRARQSTRAAGMKGRVGNKTKDEKMSVMRRRKNDDHVFV